jgi:hypothetical protein
MVGDQCHACGASIPYGGACRENMTLAIAPRDALGSRGTPMISRSKRKALTGLSCLLILASCSTNGVRALQETSPGRGQPAAAIRVPMTPYFRGLRSVKVTLDEGDYTFLVDTAGGRSLVTPETARKLGCTPRGRDVGYRMNGEPVIFKNCPQLRASLSSYEIHVAPFAVFDLNSLLPSELPRLDGVVALDSFRGQVVTLDWSQDALTIHSQADADDAIRTHGVPTRFATGENGAALSVFVPVHGAWGRMWFLLDSGNIKGTLVSRHAIQDGSIQVSSDEIAQLRVGDRNAEAIQVATDDINYDGVLGAHYLQTHAVTLDLRKSP